MKTNALEDDPNTSALALVGGVALGLGIVVHEVFLLSAAAMGAIVLIHWLLRHLPRRRETAPPTYRHA
jgi:hypothetical protein